ncbi:hypothetical protein LOC68_06145 [Blastopirellula sp. JC732]|uniref:Uncharacterized protein n=1 Tax=Blastopirellula sediminis TaxID=2894196 RepID=A0A9X1MJJ3_9BACT|nr:hypothetical protein [Blastopirellula sediminis]MCC9609254.1 hypothetical protein [Blastopirellula sediminis]MCC9627969.1 hypothetical protein [Blastopirellula sediminis]
MPRRNEENPISADERKLAEKLGFVSGQWYWIRRDDGSLSPHVFHRLEMGADGKYVGHFFVGSFLRRFPLSAAVGQATMPRKR